MLIDLQQISVNVNTIYSKVASQPATTRARDTTPTASMAYNQRQFHNIHCTNQFAILQLSLNKRVNLVEFVGFTSRFTVVFETTTYLAFRKLLKNKGGALRLAGLAGLGLLSLCCLHCVF